MDIPCAFEEGDQLYSELGLRISLGLDQLIKETVQEARIL